MDAMPLPDPSLLPDDPTVLKALVVQLLEELQKAHGRLERQEHHMDLLLRRLYGSTSEKIDPRQGVLFDTQEGEAAATASPSSPPAAASPVSKNRHQHGRGRVPDKIERKEEIHDLTEAEMAAMGGAENLVELPPERSEQLDWRPSTLFVVVHVRKKYARKMPLPESGLTLAEQNVGLARKPPEAIPGASAGPGLMAQVIVSKGADHLPLHRLEGIFQRQGVRISRQTMDGWWLATAEFLQPLYNLAVRVVLGSHVIHTDDTPVKVRDGWKPSRSGSCPRAPFVEQWTTRSATGRPCPSTWRTAGWTSTTRSLHTTPPWLDSDSVVGSVVSLVAVWDAWTGFLGQGTRIANAFGCSGRPARGRTVATCEPSFHRRQSSP